MVVAVVLDGQGRPICCELWPGNTTDVTTLIPVIDRLKQRFHSESICVVADRGMISRDTITKLQAVHRNTRYILGARLRAVKAIHAAGVALGPMVHLAEDDPPSSPPKASKRSAKAPRR